MTDSIHAFVQAVLRTRLDASGARWLAGAEATASTDALCDAYTAAPRHIGNGPIALTADERVRLRALAPNLSCEHWSIADVARSALLIAAARRLDPERYVDTATECFERGDAGEQQSWLRTISLLPDAGRFRPLAIDACRTNILPLFEAIACENPYPSAEFPERNFNQMVLKALFNGVALTRIAGLRQRANAELARMAGDYAAERRAAGRPVPSDIHLAMEAA